MSILLLLGLFMPTLVGLALAVAFHILRPP
jgi:hypothetical protein